MNEAMNNLLTRRSIRKYTDEQVPDELLDQVLEAGLHAPLGMVMQNVYLVAIRDRETRDYVSQITGAVYNSKSDRFYGAPCIVVVLVDPENCFTAQENGDLALGNMLNAAHAVGLGSCWIHSAKEVYNSPEGKALLKKWGLPERLIGIGHCILGFPAESPAVKPRDMSHIIKV